MGVYALQRLPRTRAADLLAVVVDRLVEMAEQEPGRTWWWTPVGGLPEQLRRAFPGGAWNLGLAHGAPGVIALLAKAEAAGFTARRSLLPRAVEWLLAQRLPAGAGSTFPALVAPDIAPQASPLAWCYGDPGVAGALLVVAQSTQRPEWEVAALSTAEAAAARSLADRSLTETTVCHGSAGLAHIFNRVYQATGAQTARRAAEARLEVVMDACVLRSGAAPGPDLLTGRAGLGLVLLAAASPVEPRWDSLLLLS
jgi:hypothetical protein